MIARPPNGGGWPIMLTVAVFFLAYLAIMAGLSVIILCL